MTQRDILMEYNKRKSLRATAAALKISHGVVRKTLIDYRIIDPPLVKRIAELRALGLPQKDIAELLGVSTSTVSANTSYARQSYLQPSQTQNAQMIRKSRKKKKGSCESPQF